MAAQLFQNPLPNFTGLNGQPLTSGYVYFGEPNQDPRTYPKTVYFDEALSLVAFQPLRTTAGYLYRNGAPTNVWTDGDYSLMVLDSHSRQVSYVASWHAFTAANLDFTQSGVGAVERDAQSKMRDIVSAFDFMTAAQIADVQGLTMAMDVAAALQKAITAAGDFGALLVPDGYYRIGTQLSLPYGVKLYASSPYTTRLYKAFNGDMIVMDSASVLEDIGIQGQGATYTGRGFTIGAGKTNQTFRNCRVVDFAGYCLEITASVAGLGLSIEGGEWYCTNLSQPAIKLPVDASAAPRFIRGVNTAGGFLIDTNGCDNLLLTNNRAQNMLFGASCSKVVAVGNRFSSLGADLTIYGTSHAFVGNAMAGNVVLGVGTDNCEVRSNPFATPFKVVDNSGLSTNRFDNQLTAYTPTWTAATVNPALGNGTLTGSYTRSGATVTVAIKLVIGSTTSLGTGGWSFSLPYQVNNSVVVNYMGSATALDAGTAFYVGATRGAYGASTMQAVFNAATADAGPTSPITWGTGDELCLTLTYAA